LLLFNYIFVKKRRRTGEGLGADLAMVASALHLARLAGLKVRLVVGLHRVVMVAVENITIVGQADLRPLQRSQPEERD
jgi:hypothetical protein